MGASKCAVPSCAYRRKKNCDDHRSLYRIPKDEVRALKWAYHVPDVQILTSNQYICEKHFEERYIKRYEEKTANGLFQRSRLTHNAVPTIFDTENQDGSNFNSPAISSTVPDTQFHRYREQILESIPLVVPHVSPTVSDIQLNRFRGEVSENIPSVSDIQLNRFRGEVSENIPSVSDIQLNRPRGEVLNSIPCNQMSNVETTLNDIVKDLSASEKILMQIKQEEFPPCEDGIRVKAEHIEDALKMETDEQMGELSPFEHLQNNFFHYAKKLPESWNVSQLPIGNDVIFAFSKECPIKDGLALMVMYEKNIVLNRNGNMHYSIHGKTIVISNPDIPNVLKDVESLIDIVKKFNELKVCQGISSIELEVDKDCTSYKDDLGFYRHVNCTLVSDLVQCDSCYSYSQYLLNYTLHNSLNNSVLSNDSVYYHSPIY